MKKLFILLALLALLAPARADDLAKFTNQSSYPLQASADSVSSYLFKPVTARAVATSGVALNIYSLSVKTAAVTGYVMLIDTATLPVNGPVTSLFCQPIVSNGTLGGASYQWASPVAFSTGVYAVFSTTGCDTLTLSATAKFMGQAF